MADLKKMYEKVVKSPVFNDFGYLVHYFVMLDEEFKPADSWQLGFYNKETTEIQTFSVSEPVLAVDKSKAFLHDNKEVEKLDISKVKTNFTSAIEEAKKLRLEKYKSQQIARAIVILQSLDKKITWNITFFTLNFCVLNIKVDAESGKVYHHEFGSLLHWGNKSKAA